MHQLVGVDPVEQERTEEERAKEPGGWLVVDVVDTGRGVTLARHEVPVREQSMHTVDAEGTCCCEPEDADADHIHAPAHWVHNELTTLM